jgi:hypothetical protein
MLTMRIIVKSGDEDVFDIDTESEEVTTVPDESDVTGIIRALTAALEYLETDDDDEE